MDTVKTKKIGGVWHREVTCPIPLGYCFDASTAGESTPLKPFLADIMQAIGEVPAELRDSVRISFLGSGYDYNYVKIILQYWAPVTEQEAADLEKHEQEKQELSLLDMRQKVRFYAQETERLKAEIEARTKR